MSKKKTLPVKAPAPPLPEPDDGPPTFLVDAALAQWDPATELTHGELLSLCDVTLLALWDHQVTRSFFTDTMSEITRCIAVVEQLLAESRLYQLRENLPESVTATVRNALKLSFDELAIVRRGLYARCNLLVQCPPKETMVH